MHKTMKLCWLLFTPFTCKRNSLSLFLKLDLTLIYLLLFKLKTLNIESKIERTVKEQFKNKCGP